MRAPLLVLIAVALLAACGSPGGGAAGGDAVITASTPTPSPTPEPAQVGQTVSNGGITLTVTAVREADSIEMNESGFQPDSSYVEWTTTPPGDGAKFVVIETHVINNAQTSLDLTCSLPVNTALADALDRNFDPIDDLYKLKGNPECNEQLQPGFEDDMTWVYRVPAAAQIDRWGFQDFTDPSTLGTAGWTVVRVQV